MTLAFGRNFFACLALCLAPGAIAGCGDSGSGGGGSGGVSCEGGVVVDGQCEGKCSPDLCLEGNTCVGNRCKLLCTSHNECFSPLAGNEVLQACAPEKQDTADGLNDGSTVFVCADAGKNKFFGWLCPFGNECDNPDAPGDWVCPDGTTCEEGVGSDACSAAECRALTCISKGQGDAEAYCSSFDCTSDADCGPGFYCGITAPPNAICGVDGKGDEEPCVDPANFTKDKATFQEGPTSLLRNACLKREPCAPCSNNADCSLRGDMDCVQVDQITACAARCAQPSDCPHDYTCFAEYCIPKTGTCQPPATDNFCYNCLNDLQCGGSATNTLACQETSAGQKACVDVSFPNTCTTDADCPEAPSGLKGECLDEPEGLSPGDSVYQRCYYPFLSNPGGFQCAKNN